MSLQPFKGERHAVGRRSLRCFRYGPRSIEAVSSYIVAVGQKYPQEEHYGCWITTKLMRPELAVSWSRDGIENLELLVCELSCRKDCSLQTAYLLSFDRLCRETGLEPLTMPLTKRLAAATSARVPLHEALGVVSLAWQVHIFPDIPIFGVVPSGLNDLLWAYP